jgi:hypothetical protein
MTGSDVVEVLWRGSFTNVEVHSLHAEAFETRLVDESEWNWPDLTARHQGIGTRLVGVGRDGAQAAGCEWLHVDFDDELKDFYLNACGFTPTSAGLLRLD